MSDYISRDAALKAVKETWDGCCSEYPAREIINETQRAIDNIDSVEAVPVVHGKWVMINGMKPPEYHHHHQCSVCASYATMRPPYGSKEVLSPYCPACGAKMDLEE